MTVTATESKQDRSDEFLSFLKGGDEIDVGEAVASDPETFVRTIAESIKGKYHRNNLVESILGVLNGSSLGFRDTGWAFIQDKKIPFSHLCEIVPKLRDNTIKRKLYNTRRLHHAMATRIANTSKHDIARAFFMGPKNFRDMWKRMYLPRTKFDGKEITNANFMFAYELSQKSIPEALALIGIGYQDIVSRYRVPMDKVMKLVDDPDDARGLAKITNSDDFLRHARWFRGVLGDDEFDKIMVGKIDNIKNPLNFLAKKKHLEETGAVNKSHLKKLDTRANKVIDEMVEGFDIERFAIIVDISGSMESAVDMTAKLNEVFSRMENKNVTDVIAFGNSKVFNVPENRDIRGLVCTGNTPLGGSIVKLSKNIKDRGYENIPEAILLITDMGENRSPMLNEALPLIINDDRIDNPPLIVLHCTGMWGGGTKRNIPDYPHSYITVNQFHDGLLMDVMRNIMMLTNKVAVVEKEITKVIKKREIQQEVLGDVELPVRDPVTRKRGYLASVLCS